MNFLTDKYKKIVKRFTPFRNSTDYWKKRYQSGNNSGSGSYNHLAKFKAEVINDIIANYDVKSVLELGCGDGNQLKYYNFPSYLGFDVSEDAINLCAEEFKDDKTKSFFLLSDLNDQKAKLTLSSDVIYHLVEQETFETHIQQLFNSSTKYVLIYSSNFDAEIQKNAPHVKHRKFTDYIDANYPEAKLIKHIPNRYPPNKNSNTATSISDFFLYSK